jgi:hypothetical protein
MQRIGEIGRYICLGAGVKSLPQKVKNGLMQKDRREGVKASIGGKLEV